MSLTKSLENKSYQYVTPEKAPKEQLSKKENNTKIHIQEERTVVTTKTQGSVFLRYAPKQPR